MPHLKFFGTLLLLVVAVMFAGNLAGSVIEIRETNRHLAPGRYYVAWGPIRGGQNYQLWDGVESVWRQGFSDGLCFGTQKGWAYRVLPDGRIQQSVQNPSFSVVPICTASIKWEDVTTIPAEMTETLAVGRSKVDKTKPPEFTGPQSRSEAIIA